MKIMKLRPIVLAALLFVGLPLASSYPQVGISVNVAPPVLPVYEQPPCPVEGYIWTPGYWGWGAGDYYWVPGVWVAPPSVGLLWTPPWWGWNNGAYVFNQGYWGGLSVFMEALITVMGIREMVTGAADGKETRSVITPL